MKNKNANIIIYVCVFLLLSLLTFSIFRKVVEGVTFSQEGVTLKNKINKYLDFIKENYNTTMSFYTDARIKDDYTSDSAKAQIKSTYDSPAPTPQQLLNFNYSKSDYWPIYLYMFFSGLEDDSNGDKINLITLINDINKLKTNNEKTTIFNFLKTGIDNSFKTFESRAKTLKVPINTMRMKSLAEINKLPKPLEVTVRDINEPNSVNKIPDLFTSNPPYNVKDIDQWYTIQGGLGRHMPVLKSPDGSNKIKFGL